jgi:hypothetical protein
METLDEVKNLWQQHTDKATGPALVNREVEDVIKTRIKKRERALPNTFGCRLLSKTSFTLLAAIC